VKVRNGDLLAHSHNILNRWKKRLEYRGYNFACGFVWMQNFVSDVKGGTETEGMAIFCVGV
jgi:hypothetical protein